MASENGGNKYETIEECMKELKGFKEVIENVEVTRRKLLDEGDISPSERQCKCETNRRQIADLETHAQSLIREIDRREEALDNLEKNVNVACEKINSLLLDFPLKMLSKPKTKPKKTKKDSRFVKSLENQNSGHTNIKTPMENGSHNLQSAENALPTENKQELPGIAVGPHGFKRRLTDDNLDNRLRLSARKDIGQSSRGQPPLLPTGRVNIPRIKTRTVRTLTIRKRIRKKLDTATSWIPGLDNESSIAKVGRNECIAEMVLAKWFTYAEEEKQKGSIMNIKRGCGPDTVLVLDISASMEGEAFQAMMTFATDFVTCVENVSTIAKYEENISITTIGDITKVWLHLTNDYVVAKDTLAQIGALKPSGRTPIAGGLLVGLAGCLGNRKPVRAGGVSIPSRILLISDGRGTADHIKVGSDLTEEESEDPAFTMMVYAHIEKVTRRIKMRNTRVYCISVGNANQGTLKHISDKTGGKLLCPSDLNKVLKLPDIMIKAANLVSRHLELVGYIDRNCAEYLRFALRKYQSFYLQEENETILEVATQMIDDMSGLDIVIERSNDLPALGTRVRRGPGWRYGDQDSKGPGTIYSHGKDGVVCIEWDSGVRNTYNFTNGSREVVPVNEKRKLEEDVLIATGCEVKRGKDWKFGDEDGGTESTGVVLRVNLDGYVIVRWQISKLTKLKFGANGEFEVQICDNDQNISHSNQQTNNALESVLPSIRERNRRNAHIQ